MAADQKLPIKVNDLLGAGVAAEKAISAGEAFLKTLFGPMTSELGEFFADPIREFRARRAKLIAAKAQQKLESVGQPPAEVPPRVLVPLIEHASLENDECLTDQWASLLAAAATDRGDGTLSSTFIDILRQLSPAESKVLDWMLSYYDSRRNPLHSEPMIDPRTEYDSNCFNIGQIAGDLVRSVEATELMFDNFVRLGICEDQLDADSFAAHLQGRVVFSTAPVQKHDPIRFTSLGLAFLRACRFPE